jgi:hypothetical protein
MGGQRGRHTVVAAGVGLVLGLLAVGPGLAPGFVLSYDMVFVPHPRLSAETFGLTGTLPRHVPSDAFAAVLSHMLPADVAQKTILLAIFTLACAAASLLVPSPRLTPRLAAGVVYAWNPFVAERLLLGQWALLLGYAGLPLVVLAAARGRHRRLVLALLPAAIGGFAAWAVSGLTALVVAAVASRRLRPLAATAAILPLVALPWLVPALTRTVPADPAGVAAFAARADTPFGTVGSLLLLGGGWNAETVPAGYGGPVTSALWLLVVAAALVAYAKGPRIPGLAAAAGAGLAVAALGAVVPALLRGAIGLWPAFGVLRDGQQYVAPLAVLVAAGVGLAVERLPAPAAPLLLPPVLLVPVLLLPGLAWGAGGRLRAVHYPSGWARVREVVAKDPGDVLVLPWAAYRAYPWNHGRRVLDPLPRYLPARVIADDGVRVAVRGGPAIALAAEDPRARELDPIVRSGAPLTAALAARGVRYVVLDAGVSDIRLTGAQCVIAAPHIALYRISTTVSAHEPHPARLPVYFAWFITFAAFIFSSRVPTSNLGERSRTKES